MTTLRALVGGSFLLAVMGFVVSAPLGWSIVLGIGQVYPEQLSKSRPDQRTDALVQKKILPRTADAPIRYKIVAK
jgi:hypothetical protein